MINGEKSSKPCLTSRRTECDQRVRDEVIPILLGKFSTIAMHEIFQKAGHSCQTTRQNVARNFRQVYPD